MFKLLVGDRLTPNSCAYLGLELLQQRQRQGFRQEVL
jgi:hypothetical protein